MYKNKEFFFKPLNEEEGTADNFAINLLSDEEKTPEATALSELSMDKYPIILGRAPSSVRDEEMGRLNGAYTVLTAGSPASYFKPIVDVHYIWLYSEHKELIIGVERPYLSPHAFEGSESDYGREFFANWLALVEKNALEESVKAGLDVSDKKKMMKQLERLGHPTLSSSFTDLGTALSKENKAAIAGELVFDNNLQQWTLNNRSGRYYDQKADKLLGAALLQEVAEQLSIFIGGIVPVAHYISDELRRSPESIWNKALGKEPNLAPVERGLQLMLKLFKYNIPQAKQSEEYKWIQANVFNKASFINILDAGRGNDNVPCMNEKLLTLQHIIDYCSSKQFKELITQVLGKTNVLNQVLESLPMFIRCMNDKNIITQEEEHDSAMRLN